MSAKWEKKEGTNNGKLTFEIQPEKIKEGLDTAFKRVKKSLNVPGFRKGKVPRQIFNKMYGEESLYQDALNAILPEEYSKAVKESAIKPVDQPEVNVESMDKDSAWVLSAKVTVEPEVKLGQYKDLEVTPHPTRVLKADVEKALEDKRQQQAELVLKEDKPAAKGDMVVIDYKGTVDGKAFDGGTADNQSLELGSGSFIPGFEDQLIGHKSGEDVSVKVTFPKDYQTKELAGKDSVFDTKIHEIKEKQLPKLDDEFAKDVDEDVDTLEELKAKIKEDLKSKKVSEAKSAIEDEAIGIAVDNAKIGEIPEVMIDEDIHRQMDQFMSGIKQQGISADMYYQLTGSSEEDLHKRFAKGAEKRVKTNLVLEAIVKAEDIKASEDEMNTEVENLAGQYNLDEKAVRSALSEDMLQHDIAIRKVIDEIRDSAKQTLKPDESDKGKKDEK